MNTSVTASIDRVLPSSISTLFAFSRDFRVFALKMAVQHPEDHEHLRIEQG